MLIVMPTGGGKTLPIQYYAKATTETHKFILMLVPTTALMIEQTRRMLKLGINVACPNHARYDLKGNRWKEG